MRCPHSLGAKSVILERLYAHLEGAVGVVLAIGKSNGAMLELFVDPLNLVQIPSVRLPY